MLESGPKKCNLMDLPRWLQLIMETNLMKRRAASMAGFAAYDKTHQAMKIWQITTDSELRVESGKSCNVVHDRRVSFTK